MAITIESIVEKIGKADTQIDMSLLTPDTNLEEIGADSLDVMNIFLELQDLVGFDIPDNDIDELKTVNQIYKYLTEKESV